MSKDQFEAVVIDFEPVVSRKDGDGDSTVVSNELTQSQLNMEFRQRRFREALACAAGCAVGHMTEDDFALATKRLNEAQIQLRAMWVIKNKGMTE